MNTRKKSKNVSSWAMLKWVLRYLKKRKGILAIDLGFSFIATLCLLAFPEFIKIITDEETIKSRLDIFVWCVAALFVLSLLGTFVTYISNLIGHKMGFLVESDMRQSLFCHIQKLSFSYFDNCKLGQLVSRLTSDLKDIAEFAHHCPTELLNFLLKVVGSFTILFLTNVKLAAILFAIVPALMVSILYFSHKLDFWMRKSRKKLGEINAQAENSLLGIKTVQAFSNEEFEIERFKVSNEQYIETKIGLAYVVSKLYSGMFFMMGFIYIITAVIGVWFIRQGVLTISEFIACYLYMDLLMDGLHPVAEILEKFQDGVASISRVREVLEQKPAITDPEGAQDLKDIEGKIEFKNVSFAYSGGNEAMLHHINLTIAPGEKVAIVGVSGAGKSTLCNLIPRFYEPTAGSILIDDIDIRTVTLKSLRSQIGVISQNPYLFAETIANNIAYGKNEAAQKEIEFAAKLASAHEFIIHTQDGYKTFVGERGEQLSGGQRQRISIARAFLKDAKILILDEATSALDNENEREIYNSIQKLCKGKTTIVIAHRLSTIKNADRIFVMEGGKIIEVGTHYELINKGGRYQKLYNMDQKTVCDFIKD